MFQGDRVRASWGVKTYDNSDSQREISQTLRERKRERERKRHRNRNRNRKRGSRLKFGVMTSCARDLNIIPGRLMELSPKVAPVAAVQGKQAGSGCNKCCGSVWHCMAVNGRAVGWCMTIAFVACLVGRPDTVCNSRGKLFCGLVVKWCVY